MMQAAFITSPRTKPFVVPTKSPKFPKNQVSRNPHLKIQSRVFNLVKTPKMAILSFCLPNYYSPAKWRGHLLEIYRKSILYLPCSQLNAWFDINQVKSIRYSNYLIYSSVTTLRAALQLFLNRAFQNLR